MEIITFLSCDIIDKVSSNADSILIYYLLFYFRRVEIFSARMMGRDREVNDTVKRVLYSLTSGDPESV